MSGSWSTWSLVPKAQLLARTSGVDWPAAAYGSAAFGLSNHQWFSAQSAAYTDTDSSWHTLSMLRLCSTAQHVVSLSLSLSTAHYLSSPQPADCMLVFFRWRLSRDRQGTHTPTDRSAGHALAAHIKMGVPRQCGFQQAGALRCGLSKAAADCYCHASPADV